MVKRNDSGSIHAPRYELEKHDIRLIEGVFDDVEGVELEEAQFSNPTNGLERLSIKVWSYDRGEVDATKVYDAVREASQKIGYTPVQKVDGGVPVSKDATITRDEDFYTMSYSVYKN